MLLSNDRVVLPRPFLSRKSSTLASRFMIVFVDMLYADAEVLMHAADEKLLCC